MSTFLFCNPPIEKPKPQKHIDQNSFEILHTIWILTEPCFVKKLSRFAPRELFMELTWHSRKVKVFKGSIGELRKKIPCFKRGPFRVEDGGMNQHLDIIVRKPLKGGSQVYLLPPDDEVHIPIATVSKKYVLVQHHEVLDALEAAVKQKGIDPVHLVGELKLTEYGERMWASFRLPTHGFNPDVETFFDPGDGYPVVLKVNVLNSVDKTAALEIHLTWHRLICSNGMIYGEDVDFRRIHRKKSPQLRGY